ncbi:MAG: sodium:calcium antiporter [Bacillota bacterium]
MILKLLLGLTVILIGAELFTNGIEWLGCRLGLSEGAVGSVLAAVGTALPESIIPIVAILFSNDSAASHIGIGAILGAPFMLGTLALCITGVSAKLFIWRGAGVKELNVNTKIISRDLLFFIGMYGFALGVSLLENKSIHYLTAFVLLIMYAVYVYYTVNTGGEMGDEDLKPLYCHFWSRPGLIVITFQITLALMAIIWGASFFVDGINSLAKNMGMPSLVLALIIAPIATELPEKFNSVIWIAQRKDTLALGNITGAMVFQSSVIPAFGLIFTPWQLNGTALLSGILVLSSIIILIFNLIRTGKLSTFLLIFCGVFYFIFIGIVVWGMSYV